MRLALSILKETVYDWWDDCVSRLAAALSYYTAFAIGPLLVLVIAPTGALFRRGGGERSARARAVLAGWFRGGDAHPGNDLAKAGSDDSAGWASALGILALLSGATGVFVELQNALNTVWEVKPQSGRGIIGFLQTRIPSFAMVLGIGFILLVSLVPDSHAIPIERTSPPAEASTSS